MGVNMAETLATYTVPEHHAQLYTTNVRAALAKEGGQLRSKVSNGMYSGERAQVVNFLGPLFFAKRDNVYGDTEVSETEHTQRWITGDEYDCAVYVDRLDTLKMIYQPDSQYALRMREAAARKEDDIVLDAFFAPAKGGKQGLTAITFPAGDVIAAGGTGLTVAKLRALRKLFKKKHVNLRAERPHLLVTADEVDNLFAEVAVTSSDYNAMKPLVDGEISMFMGIVFVPHEDSTEATSIPQNSGGTERQLPAFVTSGMHYGAWSEIVFNFDRLPTKNNIHQIHAQFMAGATRLEEGKVLRLDVTK